MLIAMGAQLCGEEIDFVRDVQPLVERFKVFSFPVGKVFHRGRFALDYGGGSQDFEIVEWMLAMRDELQRGAGEEEL